MNQPLAIADKEGVRRGDTKVVHHLRPGLSDDRLHQTGLAISLAHMIADAQITRCRPLTLLGVKRMLRRRLDLFAVDRSAMALRRLSALSAGTPIAKPTPTAPLADTRGILSYQ